MSDQDASTEGAAGTERRFVPPATIESRAGLVHGLTEAAELEHGLLLQYLYAALSMKRRRDEGLSFHQAELTRVWERTLLDVARQEMAHFGTVLNLLNAIGGAPHIGRPNFPTPARYYRGSDGRPDPAVAFHLTRFGTDAMTRFIRYEAPDPGPQELVPPVEPEIPWRTVAELYAAIEDGFAHLVVAGDPLFVGAPGAQESGYWRWLELPPIDDLAGARRAIRTIVEEGEGTPAAGGTSHHERFTTTAGALHEAMKADPGFEPSRAVVSDPYTRVHPEAPGGTPVVGVEAGSLIELANGVYGTMLLVLVWLWTFREPPTRRSELRRLARALMSGVVRPLGEVLTEMDADPARPGLKAGLSFELYTHLRLPADRAHASRVVYERLRDQTTVCAQLAREIGTPRLAYLAENLALAAAIMAALDEA